MSNIAFLPWRGEKARFAQEEEEAHRLGEVRVKAEERARKAAEEASGLKAEADLGTKVAPLYALGDWDHWARTFRRNLANPRLTIAKW